MAYKPPVAVYDACVLYPFHLRNLLIQLAVDGLVDARWTDEIHAEWMRNLAANNPGLSIERLSVTRDLMKRALPAADVTGYRRLVARLQLPDPDDRHVLAAAIAGKATIIVTANLADFPTASLQPYGVVAHSANEFLSQIFTAAPESLAASIEHARRNLRKSLPTVAEFVASLERFGIPVIAEAMRVK